MPPEIIKKQSQGAEVCLNHVRSTSLQTLEGFNKKATTLSQYSLSLISYSNFLFTVHLFIGQIFKCLLSISYFIWTSNNNNNKNISAPVFQAHITWNEYTCTAGPFVCGGYGPRPPVDSWDVKYYQTQYIRGHFLYIYTSDKVQSINQAQLRE